jgi:hypothetical protein
MTDFLAIDLARLAYVSGGKGDPKQPKPQPKEWTCTYDRKRNLTICTPPDWKPPTGKAIGGGEDDATTPPSGE